MCIRDRGYGGHTKEMLKCLQGQGHLYALDVDPIESVKTKERLEKAGYGEDILTIRQMNFADIDQIAREAGPFDFVLADLGVSSMPVSYTHLDVYKRQVQVSG